MRSGVEQRRRWGEHQGWGQASGKDQKLESGQIRNVLPFFEYLLCAKHSTKGWAGKVVRGG